MNHPHSDQRVHSACQRRPAFGPHIRLVNAPVSALDHHSSAVIRTQHNDDPGPHPVVDGEVITSTLTVADTNTTLRPVTAAAVVPTKPARPVTTLRRGLLRRVLEDPYWALVTLMSTLTVSITATVIYGLSRITLGVAQWLHANSETVTTTVVMITVLGICAAASTTRCAGIHCGGCKHR